MNNYPAAAAAIANDYLERVKAQLPLVPLTERDEFLRELESHIFEGYQHEAGEDDVARILAVLRKLGEPAEVVADRLPGSMVRSGSQRSLPLLVVSGLLIAIFGLPLGFGGVAVLAGLLLALGALVMAYYAVTGTVLFAAALFGLTGLLRLVLPGLTERLLTLGYIRFGSEGGLFDHLSAAYQGMFLVLFAVMFGAAGLAMLRLGKRMLLGFRFLLGLVFDWIRRFAQEARARVTRANRPRPDMRIAYVRTPAGR